MFCEHCGPFIVQIGIAEPEDELDKLSGSRLPEEVVLDVEPEELDAKPEVVLPVELDVVDDGPVPLEVLDTHTPLIHCSKGAHVDIC